MTTQQLDLFGGAIVPPGPARPRPAAPDITYAPEFAQVQPGVWTLVVYALIPKLGTENLHFPHYFGGPAEEPRWRVARHGELPGETFLFGSREQAEQVTAEVFRGATDLHRFMWWIEVPSDDHRRRPAHRTRTA